MALRVTSHVATCCLVIVLASCGGSRGQRVDRNPGNSVTPAGSGSPSIRFPPGLVPGHATVVRVDAASGAIEAVVPVGPDPLLLAIASRRVWTLNLGDGTLSRVEPSSNRATRIIPGVVVGFTSDGRDLWVARDGNVLSRLDGVT